MTDHGQFGANKPPSSAGALDCAAVESWLTEAAEEILPPVYEEKLRDHIGRCPACRDRLAQARRGRNWLLVLKQEALEPPANLAAKILAKTLGGEWEKDPSLANPLGTDRIFNGVPGGASVFGHAAGQVASESADQSTIHVADHGTEAGAGAKHAETGQDISPAWQRSSVVLLRRTLLDPRLALVAAMAFFSVTLTLNLMGVRLTKMHPADLEPQNIRRAITRQYAETNARVARYYENLRIVYEVESRVKALRRAAEASPTPRQAGGKPHKGSSDSSSDQKESHRDRMAANPDSRHAKHGTPADPKPIFAGPVMDAACKPYSRPLAAVNDRVVASTFSQKPESQASSCLLTSNLSMRERRLA